MTRRTRIAGFAVASLCLYSTVVSAQVTPPVLEVDFTGITVPLSPLLSILVAVALACAGLYALRRARSGARLLSILVVAGAALALGGTLTLTPWVGRAMAVLPSTPLPLTTSPALLSGNFLGVVNVTNMNSQNVTITAITYNPHTFDYYLSVAETTCAVGQVLTPGATCVIMLRSLG
jgi:hypothetical protein